MYQQPSNEQPKWEPYPSQPSQIPPGQYQRQSPPYAPPYPPVSDPSQPLAPQPYPQYAPYASPQQPYMQPGMQPYAPQPLMAAPPVNVMNTNVNVNIQKQGPGFLMRALYFVFIGWWAGLIWLNIGFGLCALVVTLPLGLMMLNRLPQVMTLRSPGTSTSVNVATTSAMIPGAVPGQAYMTQQVNVNVTVGGTRQYSFLIRALYFIFIGCWAGYLWANLAYFCCLTLILLPVGVMMFDRLPMVLTLRKN